MSELEKQQRDAYQATRKKHILIQLIAIAVLTATLLACCISFFSVNKATYVNYKEQGDVVYRAYLADNEFYEQSSLNGSHAYVATLIESMTADFTGTWKTRA